MDTKFNTNNQYQVLRAILEMHIASTQILSLGTLVPNSRDR